MIKAWFVVRLPQGRPAYPGDLYGPFPTRELAEQDANNGSPKTIPVMSYAVGKRREVRSRIVFYGPGSRRVRLSSGPAAESAVRYYRDHPENIPETCTHLFHQKVSAR